MRLLKRHGNQLVFETANERAFTIPYAILSHTWDQEELTFQDVERGRTNRKVLFALEQAERDGLKHIWVDTCCIDKRNYTELNESINLMWKWYANAQVCYAYLRGNFARNRWFQRGWTLQELVAPKELIFFCDEQREGARRDLLDILSAETGINRLVLDHSLPVDRIAIAERYNWMNGRETSKEEDLVYSLLGIFDIAMVLNYGCGLETAQQDLLDRVYRKHGQTAHDDLRLAMRLGSATESIEAAMMASLRFDNMASRRETIRMPVRGSCDWLLTHETYKTWLEHTRGYVSDESPAFLWVKGHPGAGKSTLMKFADEQSKDHLKQISFYFNARGAYLQRSVQGLLRSLLAQLLERSINQQLNVCKYLQETNRQHTPDWTIDLLQEVFKTAIVAGATTVRCFVDALDECPIAEVKNMIDFFDDLVQNTKGNFFVCFASRYYPTLSITNSVELRLDMQHEHTDAIEDYVKTKLQVDDSHFGKAMQQKLINKANGIFMWVVLVTAQLNVELDKGRLHELPALVDALPDKLSDLYHELATKDDDVEAFRLCIQLIYFSDPPLKDYELYYAVLFGLDKMSIDARKSPRPSPKILARFISSTSRGLAELVSGTPGSAQFIHESVRDFLTTDRGLESLLSTHKTSIAASSHERIKCLMVKYLAALHPICDEGGLSFSGLSRDRAADILPWSSREKWRFWTEMNAPLLQMVGSRLLYHSEASSLEINQDEFLKALDWRALAAAHVIFNPGLDGQRIYALGLLALHRVTRLSLIVLRFPDVDRARLFGPMPMVEIVMNGVLSDVERAYRHGVDLEQVDADGFTALVRAMECNKDDMAQFLIQRGANVNVRARFGEPLLMFASKHNVPATIGALIARQVDINEQDTRGCTALMAACHTGQLAVVKVLLKHGAQVDKIDHLGRTALFYCDSGFCLANSRAVHLLLHAGADVHALDAQGHSVLSLQITILTSNNDECWDKPERIDLIIFLLIHEPDFWNRRTPHGHNLRRLTKGLSSPVGRLLDDLLLGNWSVRSTDWAPNFSVYWKLARTSDGAGDVYNEFGMYMKSKRQKRWQVSLSDDLICDTPAEQESAELEEARFRMSRRRLLRELESSHDDTQVDHPRIRAISQHRSPIQRRFWPDSELNVDPLLRSTPDHSTKKFSRLSRVAQMFKKTKVTAGQNDDVDDVSGC